MIRDNLCIHNIPNEWAAKLLNLNKKEKKKKKKIKSLLNVKFSINYKN